MILTVGHSTRTSDEMLELLRAHDVDLLVDIRRFPGSRRHPQFNSEQLAAALTASGIEYAHAESLGGRRRPLDDSPNRALRNEQFRGYADHMQSEEFARALDRLIELARQRTVAVMCAEAVPWRCHRSLLADALRARDVDVAHIIDARAPSPHSPTKGAVFREGVVTYPGPDDPGQLRLTTEDPKPSGTR